jgi:hypothetical protein
MQIAAALKTRSPAALAETRLDITKPTAPTNVTIDAIIGKNIAFESDDSHQLAHLGSCLLILVNQAGAAMSAATATTAGARVYSAGASVGLAAGFGTPMRNLLSNSDNVPPHIITTAPNQMSSTIGL